MRRHLSYLLIPFFLVLSGCGTSSSISTGSGSLTLHNDTQSLIPGSLLESTLRNAKYTLIDPTVRIALTNAGQDFDITLQDGMFTYPPSVLAGHFQTVSADMNNISYGDLTGDGLPDALVRVQVGVDEFSKTELAAFTASGSTAVQFAAFPLGHAIIKSLAITDGKIRVNFTHNVSGDPGPRNSELTLELPKK